MENFLAMNNGNIWFTAGMLLIVAGVVLTLAASLRPVRIERDGPVFVRTIVGPDGNITGEEEGEVPFRADTTFIAISQGPKSKLVDTTEGLKPSKNGLLLTDEKGETTHPGIFAAGDVVLGARTVVEATAYAKKVARSMDEYVRSLS